MQQPSWIVRPSKPNKPNKPGNGGHSDGGNDNPSYNGNYPNPDSYEGHSDEFWDSLSYIGGGWYEDEYGNRYYYPNGIPRTGDTLLNDFGLYAGLLFLGLAGMTFFALRKREEE